MGEMEGVEWGDTWFVANSGGKKGVSPLPLALLCVYRSQGSFLCAFPVCPQPRVAAYFT